MEASDKRKNKANAYDKLLKENLGKTLPTLIQEVLRIQVLKIEELPLDLQQTKERKPDLIKKITDSEGNIFLLHLEFQVADEKDMIFRMAEYYIMLFRKFRLQIKQYVLFLKEPKPRMKTQLNTDCLSFKYNLIALHKINYKIFLNSTHPEVRLLTVLADLGEEDPYLILKNIVQDLNKNTDLAKSKYFRQLRIFIQLRSKLENQLDRAMETISEFFKEEQDFLYRKGEAKGEAKGLAMGEAKGLAMGEAKGLDRKSVV